MSFAVNKVTLEILYKINAADYKDGQWLIDPILPNVSKEYWKVVGETIEEMTAPEKAVVDGVTETSKMDAIRITRNSLLLSCDWTQLADVPLLLAKKTEWITYRQVLRDIPQTYLADAVVWPAVPTK